MPVFSIFIFYISYFFCKVNQFPPTKVVISVIF